MQPSAFPSSLPILILAAVDSVVSTSSYACAGMSGRIQKKNGDGGDSDSDSGCNIELTLGGSYGEIDDEMPVLTLSSSSVFEIDGVKDDSGEHNVPLPDDEFAAERSLLSLRMSVPPALPEMRTIKELQTMRRQEVKRRLMGKSRGRAGGRPSLHNQIQSQILFPAISQPSPPFKAVTPSSLLSPTPVSFFCLPPTPSTSSPPLSPMPVSFKTPLPPPQPPPPPPPPLPAPPQHSSQSLPPMPLPIIRPRRQSSSPPLSSRPSSFRLPSSACPPSSQLSTWVADPAHPHFPVNGDGHKMAIPESLPVEILRPLVVRWMQQHRYKRLRAFEGSDLDTALDLIKKMPTVVATGAGPDGKRIEGFLCKFGTEEVSLVCICHGMFFTPADFVKHAGADVVENPMKQIIVCPTPF